MTPCERERRPLRHALKDLVAAVEVYLRAMDEVMRGPSTVERGRALARLSNGLEMAKDSVRFGALNIDFRTGRPRARRKVERRITE